MKKFFLILLVFLLLLGCTNEEEAKSHDNEKINTNEDEFAVLETMVDEEKTIYVVSQKGFRNDIKIEFQIKDNNIANIKIIEHYETNSYFNRIKNANYLEKIIDSDNIAEIDTISGATVSSKALKNAAINTLNYHENK